MLTNSQKTNIRNLVSIALNTYYTNLDIVNAIPLSDSYIIDITRNISITHLKKMNEYFGTDIRTKTLRYELTVSKENDIIELKIQDIKSNQISMFESEALEVTNKVNSYNDKITARLINYYPYIYETLYPTDTDVKNWTFYYISNRLDHIGFANADKDDKHCIKIYKNDFYMFINEDVPKFYDNVTNFVGTYNDAKCACIKRNYNSTSIGNWEVCPYGSSIRTLWPLDSFN